jgi:hypothetical protein
MRQKVVLRINFIRASQGESRASDQSQKIRKDRMLQLAGMGRMASCGEVL